MAPSGMTNAPVMVQGAPLSGLSTGRFPGQEKIQSTTREVGMRVWILPGLIFGADDYGKRMLVLAVLFGVKYLVPILFIAIHSTFTIPLIKFHTWTNPAIGHWYSSLRTDWQMWKTADERDIPNTSSSLRTKVPLIRNRTCRRDWWELMGWLIGKGNSLHVGTIPLTIINQSRKSGNKSRVICQLERKQKFGARREGSFSSAGST